jgi:hypothetical protein
MLLTNSVLALQEALVFEEEGNEVVHFFMNTELLFKCERGFYNAGQILAIKNKKLDWIWILMVPLTIGLMIFIFVQQKLF